MQQPSCDHEDINRDLSSFLMLPPQQFHVKQRNLTWLNSCYLNCLLFATKSIPDTGENHMGGRTNDGGGDRKVGEEGAKDAILC